MEKASGALPFTKLKCTETGQSLYCKKALMNIRIHFHVSDNEFKATLCRIVYFV